MVSWSKISEEEKKTISSDGEGVALSYFSTQCTKAADV